MESTLRAQRLTGLIDEFTTGITAEEHVAAGQPEPSEQKILASQPQQLSSMVGEITSDGLARFLLKKHIPHINRMEEREKQSGELLNDWNQNIQVLLSVARFLQRNEIEQKRFDAQAQTRTPIPEPQLSEGAQRMAKLTKVDQQLLRAFGEKYRILLKRRLAEGRAESVC